MSAMARWGLTALVVGWLTVLPGLVALWVGGGA